MTWDEWTQIARVLAAAFHRQDFPAETVAVYFRSLHRFRTVYVERAVQTAIEASRFFPSVALLLEFARDEIRAENERARLANPRLEAGDTPATPERVRELLDEMYAKVGRPTSAEPSDEREE